MSPNIVAGEDDDEVSLPVFIQKGGKGLRIFSSHQVELIKNSLEDLLTEGLSTFKPYFIDRLTSSSNLSITEKLAMPMLRAEEIHSAVPLRSKQNTRHLLVSTTDSS